MGRYSKSLAAAVIGAAALLLALAASAAPAGFTGPEAVFTGLDYPTNIEFSSDGRVFVTEKKGIIKYAPSINSPNLVTIHDIQSRVHNYWDRGLLGLAVHPQFPAEPYLYVLYTHGAPLPVPGGPTQTWESGSDDPCPSNPGGTANGCVVSGQLARIEFNPSTMAVVGDTVLIHDWCQQYPSHSIGDLEFGADGYLYATGGDGASFNYADWGQSGGNPGTITPRNPCGDPPVGAGQTMPTDGSAEGGALRAQDLRTSGDPVSLSGTVIRIHPEPGNLVPPSNPGVSHPDPLGKLIVGYGLRNPYRFTIRPGTNDLYMGDVGWSTWEEVNRHANPSSQVRNFGWPCYEGGYSAANGGSSIVMGSYSHLNICGTLGMGSVSAPFFAYRHDQTITHPTNDACPPAQPGPTTRTSSSTTGLAFYTGGGYPGLYNGSLFGADYSRNCIWIMYAGTDGLPDPTTVEVFHYGPSSGGQQGISPVDLEMGPDGNMWMSSYLRGHIARFRFTGSNTPPIARITATPTSGGAPLAVNFNGITSSDPDGDPIVEYAWDFTNNGTWDQFGPSAQFTYQQPGSYTARLRVTDSRGEAGTTTINIQASNSPPQPMINTPAAGLLWSVGDTITFSGSATDPEEGTLPASRLQWSVILHHCADDGSCHEHPVTSISGVSSGSFHAPDHEYPSHLEIRLTARDQFNVTTTASRTIQPRTVQLGFNTIPAGLQLSVVGATATAPIGKTVIVGSSVSASALSPQGSAASGRWHFLSWSNGGSASQTITAPSSPATYTATFQNRAPDAVISANPTGGSAPLTVQFNGSGSSDPDGDNLTFAWDLDGDGAHDDSTAVNPTRQYQTPGSITVSLRVTDPLGHSDTATVVITPGNDPPQANISSPGAGTRWSVGQVVAFSGSASDTQDGSIPGEGLAWEIVLRECDTCAPATIATASGTSGSFVAPTAGPEARIEIRLMATDSHGASTNATRTISPRTVDLTFDTDPSGLTVTVAGETRSTPHARRFVVGTPVPLEAITPQLLQGEGDWIFVAWSNGGTRAQTIVAPASSTTYTAVYDLVKDEPPIVNSFFDDDGHLFEEDIEWLAAEGITRGCNPPANDLFCPDDPVTRGQMAAFFVRALGLTADSEISPFADDDGHLFESEIGILATAGITRGCNPPANDRFCPDDLITRGQMAAFFVRAMGLSGGAGDDLFVDDDGHLFEAELDMLGTSGISRGCNPPANNMVCPDQFVTRGQMAAFFHRAAPWLP